jgi:hypothetical protein
MTIRFRDLEVPVAVGLLVLSAFLGITGWNRQPSNGTEITGGQIVGPPVGVQVGSACEDEVYCMETRACTAWNNPTPGVNDPYNCEGENAYQWHGIEGSPDTNCKPKDNSTCSSVFGDQGTPCARSIWKCRFELFPNEKGEIVGRCYATLEENEVLFMAKDCW